MPDTPRTLAQVKALLADNNSGEISPQDLRDVVESIVAPVPGFPGVNLSKDMGHFSRTRGSSANQLEKVHSAEEATFGAEVSVMQENFLYVISHTEQPTDTANIEVDLSGWLHPDPIPSPNWWYDQDVPANTSFMLPRGRYDWWWRVAFTGAVGAGGQVPDPADRIELYVDTAIDPITAPNPSDIENNHLNIYDMYDTEAGSLVDTFGESSNRGHVRNHGHIVVGADELPMLPFISVWTAAVDLRLLRSVFILVKVA